MERRRRPAAAPIKSQGSQPPAKTKTGLCVALCVLLAGCASQPMMKHTQACPVPQVWSKDEMKALGAALAPVPEDSPIMRMEMDWQAMRDELRACR